MTNTNAITFFQLMTAFKTGAPIMIQGIKGIVSAIEREDGSGKCWNVIVRHILNGKMLPTLVPMFVRTID